jgi:iron complex outermembrane receptor protein
MYLFNKLLILLFLLSPSSLLQAQHQLNKINISAQKKKQKTLDHEEIQRHEHQTISHIIDELPQSSLIQTGQSISKPIVGGLWGNRVNIVWSETNFNAQQWGIDHGLEIETPQIKSIELVENKDLVRYQGNSLGTSIKIIPMAYAQDEHLHGQAGYLYQTNGQGHLGYVAASSKFKDYLWKASVSYRNQGDGHTPNYLLTNTAHTSLNAYVGLLKPWNEHSHSELTYQVTEQNIGLLTGAHISNLTDLNDAFTRTIPFGTQTTFSRNINRPNQVVTHHIAEFQHHIVWNKIHHSEFIYSFQWNLRREFDNSRIALRDIPQLSLSMLTNNFDLAHHIDLPNKFIIDLGLQITRMDNFQDQRIQTPSIIPNYIQNQISLYQSISKEWQNKSKSFLSFRSDLRINDFSQISRSISEQSQTNRTNPSIAFYLGHNFKLTQGLNLDLQGQIISRAPAANEWYSFGLHQGVSSIEEGNPNLNNELAKKIKLTLSQKTSFGFTWDIDAFVNWIDRYIYLYPTLENRLTIRGAYPVFAYRQTDARIIGIDARAMQRFGNLSVHAHYQFTQGDDLSQALPLVLMPQNLFQTSLSYEFSLAKVMHHIEAAYRHNFQQNHLAEFQDFLKPPPAYSLINLNWTTEIPVHDKIIDLSFRIDNLLNTTYRNYLNRYRYFADELGRNLVFALKYHF